MQSEYICARDARRAFISGFTGSAGLGWFRVVLVFGLVSCCSCVRCSFGGGVALPDIVVASAVIPLSITGTILMI
jgi:hypothetical protein